MSTAEQIDKSLFDEALRAGERSVTQANKQMMIARAAVDAIADALELLKTGRTHHARERLDKALMSITRMSR